MYFENIEKAKNDPQMKEIFEKSDLAMTFVYLYLLVCSDEERENSIKFLLRRTDEIIANRKREEQKCKIKFIEKGNVKCAEHLLMNNILEIVKFLILKSIVEI